MLGVCVCVCVLGVCVCVCVLGVCVCVSLKKHAYVNLLVRKCLWH